MSDSNKEDKTVECSSCKSLNPAGKNYCADCGTFLGNATDGAIKDYLDNNLRSQVLSVIEERYKDQKLVEAEVAEGIATKLSGWAKLLAFFVGIPLTVVVLILGAIGIKDLVDFTTFVSKAKKDAEENVEKARKEGESITGQYQSLKDQLAQATSLASDVKVLSAKVNQISEKIGFVPTAALTPDLQERMEKSLDEFRRYLQNIGYKVTENELKIAVSEKQEFGPAYYQEGVIHVEAAFATDIDILYREYSHHALLTSKGTLSSQSMVGIESGFASYFACSFTGDPAWGEKSVSVMAQKYQTREFLEKGAIQALKNSRKFSDLAENPLDNSYLPAEVWGGLFWELREGLGREYTDRLLFETWQSLLKNNDTGKSPADVYNRMVEVDKSLDGNHLQQIQSVFSRRGFSV